MANWDTITELLRRAHYDAQRSIGRGIRPEDRDVLRNKALDALEAAYEAAWPGEEDA